MRNFDKLTALATRAAERHEDGKPAFLRLHSHPLITVKPGIYDQESGGQTWLEDETRPNVKLKGTFDIQGLNVDTVDLGTVEVPRVLGIVRAEDGVTYGVRLGNYAVNCVASQVGADPVFRKETV